jgi:hypothetical protein
MTSRFAPRCRLEAHTAIRQAMSRGELGAADLNSYGGTNPVVRDQRRPVAASVPATWRTLFVAAIIAPECAPLRSQIAAPPSPLGWECFLPSGA